ncbi:putative esterase [Alloactinosynnema sp. L-07]|uniref:acetylxylan esterase n=1 Tax=Alloactinosynnema sp. L-07 TaxID=1653480 RepID=UPI00065EF498|nr:acetylxylan esterase [Alloactinosynnema sp. L-07]CRK56630.1 putative esterase [Alloactinosynnema sp. L-07]
MPLTDLTLDECLALQPRVEEPDDFDAFWDTTLAESRASAGPVVARPVDTGFTGVITHDVTVPGFGGHPVKGWLQVPVNADGPLPCVVEFLGYGRGRGLPHQSLFWAAAGFAHLVMDTRGQGWITAIGATPDPAPPHVAAVPGFLTRGIDDPHDHYYRRVITDAVAFADATRQLPHVDPGRVFVAGHSQGGGLALAVAGLAHGLAGVLTNVPFLCDFRRAVRICGTGLDATVRRPYTEIGAYLAATRADPDRVFRTLSYFDAAVHAARATAPALFAIAMMDQVCPASTCFAAFHNHGGPKDLRVYEFNDHEGGGEHHRLEELAWARAVLQGTAHAAARGVGA